MKNIIIIDAEGEQLVSSVDDGSNALFLNDTEIDSGAWVGSGYYTTTLEGYELTVKKADSLDGNVILVKTDAYTYELRVIDDSEHGTATSYNDLADKPQIEGVTLRGNKTYEDLNLQPISNAEMEELLTI